MHPDESPHRQYLYAPRGKVIDLPPDVALVYPQSANVWGTSPFRHWGQVAWSNAKDFTRKQLKGCCIRDLAFVALTCTAAPLHFPFPAGHFLSLSGLSLHIVSFQILSTLKQSLPLHPAPVSTLPCFFLDWAVCRLAERQFMVLCSYSKLL